jgi:hypothetical protein
VSQPIGSGGARGVPRCLVPWRTPDVRGRSPPRAALGLAIGALLSTPLPALAASANLSGIYTLNSGAGVNMWTGGGAVNIQDSVFLGTSWNRSGGFGGVEKGLFGDSYGLEVNATTRGRAGIRLGYHATSGLVTAQAPFDVRLDVPDVVRPGETMRIRSSVDLSGLAYQTASPDFGFRMGLELDLFASARGRACFIDCFGFDDTLVDVSVRPELLSVNYDNTAPTIPQSYDQQVVLFRDSPFEINPTPTILGLLGREFSLYRNAAGASLINLRYGAPDQTSLFPSIQAIGAYRDGAAAVDASGFADLASASLNLTALATQLGVLPPLEGDLSTFVPDAPGFADDIGVQLLRVNAGVGLGFRQNFSLETPTVLIDLDLKNLSGEVLGTYTLEAGKDADVNIPLSLLNLADASMYFEPTIRFAPTSLNNDTELTLTPFVNVAGPAFTFDGNTVVGPLPNFTWRLPLPGVSLFENEFDVQFEGTPVSGVVNAGINRDQIATAYALSGGELRLENGIDPRYVSQRILADGPASRVVTTGPFGVQLLNTTIDGSAGPYLDVEQFLILGTGSQVAIGDVRNRRSIINVIGSEAQIGSSDERTVIHNGGSILIEPFSGGGFGELTISDADILGDFDDPAAFPGRVIIRPGNTPDAPNRLNLTDVGAFVSRLENDGVVTIRNLADAAPTRFSGALNDNIGRLEIESGAVEFATDMRQTRAGEPAQAGHIALADRLTVRAELRDGTLDMTPGARLTLLDDARLAQVGVTGRESVVEYGNAELFLTDLTLDGGSGGLKTALRPVATSADPAPELRLTASTVTLRQAAMEVSAQSTLRLASASRIDFRGREGRLETARGSLVNAGIVRFEGLGTSTISSDRGTLDGTPAPALVNEATGRVEVTGGATARIEGGLLNLGTLDIQAPEAGTADGNTLRVGGAAGAGSLNDLVTTGTVNIDWALILESGARLVIDDGTVNLTGRLLAGDVVNNAGNLLVDSRGGLPGFSDQPLAGTYTQTGGTLTLGAQTLTEGLTVDGSVNLGGTLDLSALQLALDGGVPGFSLNLVEGELYTALNFGARTGEFSAYVLPELADFFWLPIYQSDSLQFRLTEFRDYPVPLASGFQTLIGTIPGDPDEVIQLSAEEALLTEGTGPVVVGNAFSGAGLLELRQRAILTTDSTGLTIDPTGRLDAREGAIVRALGAVTVNGGALAMLEDSRLITADGVALTVRNGGSVVLEDGGYQVAPGGSLTVESGAVMTTAGGLDLPNTGSTSVTISGGSTVTADAIASSWRADPSDFSQVIHDVRVTGGGTLRIGALEAVASYGVGSRVDVLVSGPGSAIEQQGDASLRLGAGTGEGADNVVLRVHDGGRFRTGTGDHRLGGDSAAVLDGGVLDLRGDLELQGGAITGQASSGLLLNGHDVTAKDYSALDFSTPYGIDGGSAFDLSGGSRLLVDGFLDIAGEGSVGDGTLVASGAGTSVIATAAASLWGANGNTANVVFRAGARGDFGDLLLASDGAAGSTAAVFVEGTREPGVPDPSRASLVIEGLELASSGGTGSSAVLRVSDGGLFQEDGAAPAVTVIGHASEGSARVEIGDGSFWSARNTGGFTINRTGTVLVADGGDLRISSDLLVDGGVLDAGSAFFERSPGRNLTVSNGGTFRSVRGPFVVGDGTFMVTGGSTATLANMVAEGNTVVVSGAGSRLGTAGMTVNTYMGVIAGSAVTSSGQVTIGSDGRTGFVELENASTLALDGSLYIGAGGARPPGDGELWLTGAGTRVDQTTNGQTVIGGPTGLLRIADQAVYHSDGIVATTSTGRIEVAGGTLEAFTLSHRGFADVAGGRIDTQQTFLVDDDAVLSVSGGDFSARLVGGGRGTLAVNGGRLADPDMAIDVGTFVLGESTGAPTMHTASATDFAAAQTRVGGVGTLTFAGGTQDLTDVIVEAGGSLELSAAATTFAAAGAMTVGGSVRIAGGSATSPGPDTQLDVTDGGSLTVTGGADVSAFQNLVATGASTFTVSGPGTRLAFTEHSETQFTGALFGFGGASTIDVTDGAAIVMGRSGNPVGGAGFSLGASIPQALAGVVLPGSGILTIDGPDSRVEVTAPDALAYVGSSTGLVNTLPPGTDNPGGNGTVVVRNGGVLRLQADAGGTAQLLAADVAGSTASLSVAGGGALIDAGGLLALGADATGATGGIGALQVGTGGTFAAGRLIVGADSDVAVTGGTATIAGDLDLDGVVAISAGRFEYGGALALGAAGRIDIDGGTFATPGITDFTGIDWRSGTLELTASDLRVEAGGLLGDTLQLPEARAVVVGGTTVVGTSGIVVVDNGNLTSASYDNQGEIVLTNPSARLRGGTLANAGLVRGDGRVEGGLQNGVAGEVRTGTGQSMTFAGATNVNEGAVNVTGGTVEFTNGLTNAATGNIAGQGTLITDGVFENLGNVSFSGAVSNVFGEVRHEGTMLVTGESTVTFHGPMTNDGTEFRVTPGSLAVFLNEYSGASGFTGLGTVLFDGLTNAGNSPGLMDIEGDSVFGRNNRLTIELGGTSPGEDFDRWEIAGDAWLGGTLEFELIGGFLPTPGETYDFLAAEGRLLGTYLSVRFPDVEGLGFGLQRSDRGLALTVFDAPVPLPAPVWLLGAGFGWLLWRRRRSAHALPVGA